MEDLIIDFVMSVGSYPFLSLYILGCIVALIAIFVINNDDLEDENAQWGLIPAVVLLSWISVIACIYYKIKDN